jgi:hypothetical protein
LIDQLVEINKTPSVMNIPSSLIDGYIVDYENKFPAYFSDGLYEGWALFHKTEPNGRCYIVITAPVYEPRRNIVFVYYSIYAEPTGAGGWFIAYKYENGSLEEITRAELWYS